MTCLVDIDDPAATDYRVEVWQETESGDGEIVVQWCVSAIMTTAPTPSSTGRGWHSSGGAREGRSGKRAGRRRRPTPNSLFKNR
jgi:hypothetical protein